MSVKINSPDFEFLRPPSSAFQIKHEGRFDVLAT